MNRWKKTLHLGDVFRGPDPFPQRRDLMVSRIRRLSDDPDLHDIADRLELAQDGDEWDGPWDDFYDWADANSVWVDTFGSKAATR